MAAGFGFGFFAACHRGHVHTHKVTRDKKQTLDSFSTRNRALIATLQGTEHRTEKKGGVQRGTFVLARSVKMPMSAHGQVRATAITAGLAGWNPAQTPGTPAAAAVAVVTVDRRAAPSLRIFGPNLATFESQKSKYAQPETLSCQFCQREK